MIFKARPSATIAILIVSLILVTAICALTAFILPIIFDAIFTIGIILIIALIVYLPLLISNTYCQINSGSITVCSGVLIKHRSTIKSSSIIYLTECTTPLSQFTNLNFLIINALGAKTVLCFLSKSDCKKIKEITSL